MIDVYMYMSCVEAHIWKGILSVKMECMWVVRCVCLCVLRDKGVCLFTVSSD